MKVTYILIAINVVLYLIGWQWPLTDAWQLIGYGFSHYSGLHLAVNMIGLLMLGLAMENEWGEIRMALFYLVSIAFGGLVQLGLAGVPTVGASAGIFGLMTAFCVVFPERKVWLFFIPMQAQTLLVVSVAIEVIQELTGITPGIAHWAHLGGVLGAGMQLVIRK